MTRTAAILRRAAPERADRAAAALESMTGGAAGPAPAAVEKGLTLSRYARLWLKGVERSVARQLTEPLDPYRQSLWFHTCVCKIQTSVKGVPLSVMRQSAAATVRAKSHRADIRRSRRRTLRPVAGRKAVCVGRAAEGETVGAGPAVDLLERPNPHQDWPALAEATVGHLYRSGKAAWLLADMVGNRPREIYVLDGARVEPQIDRDGRGLPVLLGYKYRKPGGGYEPLAPDECKYFCLWAGSDNPLEGLSPASPGRFAIATDYGGSMYHAAVLANDVRPGAHIDFPGGLTEEQKEEFTARMVAEHGGPAKAGRMLVTGGGAKLTTWDRSPNEAQTDQGLARTRLEICALLGVPPAVAGFSGFTGDSSAMVRDSMELFYEFTIFPLLDGLAPAIQEIADRVQPGLLVFFDVEDNPVVQRMRLARYDAAKTLFGLTYPPNVINEELSLGLPRLDHGDVGWVSSSVLPATELVSAAVLPPEGERPAPGSDEFGQAAAENEARKPKSETDDAKASQEAARLWHAWMASWAGLRRRVTGSLRLRYARQQRAAVAALKASGYAPPPRRGTGKAGEHDSLVEEILARVFDDPEDRRKWRVKVEAFAGDAQRLGLRQALAEAGLEAEALEEALRRLTTDPRLTAALHAEAVIVSTKIDAFTRKVLKRSLAEGMEAGETVRKLTDRVQAVMGNRRAAAETVARNVVGQTLSRARHEGQRAAGLSHKYWVQSQGPGERRASHALAAGEYPKSDPIPLEEAYVIHREDGRGDVRLMYPRDPSAACPSETVNCQCLSVAVRRGGGDEGAATPAPRAASEGFLSYEAMCEAERAAAEDAENGEKRK